MLAIRLAEARHDKLQEADLFTTEFLIERPILRSVTASGPVPPVLLLDEIDRADDEFEALLLEFLGEASVTIPELGTFAAARPPYVVALVQSAADFVGRARQLDLDKPPGLAETIDWVAALSALGVSSLGRDDALRTLSAIAKSPDDVDAMTELLAPSEGTA